jgi:hypothetical protein
MRHHSGTLPNASIKSHACLVHGLGVPATKKACLQNPPYCNNTLPFVRSNRRHLLAEVHTATGFPCTLRVTIILQQPEWLARGNTYR